jgi:hypothetical protein
MPHIQPPDDERDPGTLSGPQPNPVGMNLFRPWDGIVGESSMNKMPAPDGVVFTRHGGVN